MVTAFCVQWSVNACQDGASLFLISNTLSPLCCVVLVLSLRTFLPESLTNEEVMYYHCLFSIIIVCLVKNTAASCLMKWLICLQGSADIYLHVLIANCIIFMCPCVSQCVCV